MAKPPAQLRMNNESERWQSNGTKEENSGVSKETSKASAAVGTQRQKIGEGPNQKAQDATELKDYQLGDCLVKVLLDRSSGR